MATKLGVDFEIRTTTELQRQAGYTSCYLLINLSIMLVLFASIILVYLISKAIDCVSEYTPRHVPIPNGRTNVKYATTPDKVMNTLIRLLLLAFLEFFVCALMNIKADTSMSNSTF